MKLKLQGKRFNDILEIQQNFQQVLNGSERKKVSNMPAKMAELLSLMY
jgi:hypothetical protein